MWSYLRFKASLNGQRWSFLRVCPDWNQHLEKILASQVFALTRNSCMRVPRMCQVMFNCSPSCKRKASIEVYHPSGTFCLIPYKRSAFFTSQCAETSYRASARLRRRGAQWRESTNAGDFWGFSTFYAKCWDAQWRTIAWRIHTKLLLPSVTQLHVLNRTGLYPRNQANFPNMLSVISKERTNHPDYSPQVGEGVFSMKPYVS